MNNYSILDGSNTLVELSNKISSFKKTYCQNKGIDFSGSDYRIVTLDSIQQFLLSLALYIRGFCIGKECINDQIVFINELKLGITAAQIEEIIYKFPIEALIIRIHFQIDSFLSLYLKMNNMKPGKYYNNVNSICRYLFRYRKIQKKYSRYLHCLGYFRNSFHNQGKHIKFRCQRKGELDVIFKVNQNKIEFRNEKEIEYNWRSAISLLEESINSLIEIIKLT